MSAPPSNCRLNHRLGLVPLLIAVFSVCLLTVSSLAQGIGYQPPLRWESDLNVATARAEQENRPLFIHFCLPNQQMETEVFVHTNIASHLQANYVIVKINASENASLAQKFAVTAVPTDIILKAGQIIHRRVGEITADRFSDYLGFLQKTIQSDKNPAPAPSASVPAARAPFQGTNPVGFPNVVPPATAVQPQPGTVPPPDNISILDVVPDPFGRQQLPGGQQTLMSMDMVPPPINNSFVQSPFANNPLRITESAVRPAIEHESPAYKMSNAPQVLAEKSPPLATGIMPAMLEVPAPAKMMIEVPLALEGFCPVTLCAEERWVSGNPAYCTMYQGHIFRFASLEALTTFVRNPANYIPVAMGEDIVLMADRNKRVEGDRKFGAWFQGRIFLFSSQETLNAFENRPRYYMDIALKYETARKEPSIPLIY